MPPLTVPSNVHYIIQVYKNPISEKQITYSPRFVVKQFLEQPQSSR